MPSNYVSEWFGHRVYPSISSTAAALADQQAQRCPFLSSVLSDSTECVKSAASRGICTISSLSNGPRQDWLACPYRAVDSPVVHRAAEILFTNRGEGHLFVVPFPSLSNSRTRRRFYRSVREHGSAIVYFQDKLGGEISVSRSPQSPEFSFDVTLAEVTHQDDGSFSVERFGILELQTMDFHGSYRHTVQNLQDALRLHGDGFPVALRQNPEWAGEKIEGPNIANVFKRTFYQILMKFRVATHPECAGVVFAIPQAVWDSWQRHLGKPSLSQVSERIFELRGEQQLDASNSWIVVFDVDSSSRTSPDQIVITTEIRTDGDTLATQAFKRAPDLALEHGTTPQELLATIRGRMVGLIPELG